LYNEPALPDIEDVRAVLEKISYPVESLDIGILIVKAEQEMGHLDLSASTVGQYRHAWMDIYRHFFLQGTTPYRETIVQEFIDQITSLRERGQIKDWKWKINRKAAYVLIEVADSGLFRWSTISQDLRIADEGLEEVRDRYLFYLKSHNLQPATVSLHDYAFRSALEHARITTLSELGSFSPHHVQDAITGFSSVCSKRSLSTILPIVRKVLGFLYEEGFIRSRLSGMVMGVFVQKGNVAAYISPDDEEKLLAEIECGTRRDKAIILLLLRLGLRECDICELTLQEIEWKNDRIGLVQKKTGRLLALPLLPDVGNALMDYIVEERPNRADGYPYVFLRKQAPHNRLSSLYHLCSGLAKRLQITPVSGHTLGAHLYRYTLVHRLLAAQVPHQVITDILGHTSKESDKPYLSMEESMLRACAIDLSVIGKVSWGEAYDD
jgi:integrase